MNEQFKNLSASELFCPRCRVARPVRERLLLVLPGKEIYDFRCMACGESCGTREVVAGPVAAMKAAAARHAAARRPARRPPGAAAPRAPKGLLGKG